MKIVKRYIIKEYFGPGHNHDENITSKINSPTHLNLITILMTIDYL